MDRSAEVKNFLKLFFYNGKERWNMRNLTIKMRKEKEKKEEDTFEERDSI